MSENYCSLELKDFMDSLRDENKRLLRHLSFAQKCMNLFEKYRNCLNSFAIHCICDQNFDNQLELTRLEKEYRLLANEDIIISDTTPDTNQSIDISFNKRQKVTETDPKTTNESTGDNNTITLMSTTSDQLNQTIESETNSGNNLLNKLNEELKTINEDNDYRLMFLTTNSNDKSSEHFVCNWFNCGLSFGSEATLNQHKKCTHFKVYEEYDKLSVIVDTNANNEITIDYESHISDNTSHHSNTRLKYKPKRLIDDFICDWVGCQMEFRTDSELRRHRSLVHTRDKKPTAVRTTKFLGFKPLTIHSLDSSGDQISTEKPFKCDLCDRSYTRKDSLKYHMSADHKLGDHPIKTYFCDHCEYETKNSGHMKRHVIRRHTNERPFRCDLDYCDPNIRCFATLEQLKSHQINIHSVSDPF